MRKIFLLYVIFGLSIFNSKAQITTGNGCNSATPFVPSNSVTQINQTLSDGWLCFTANTQSLVLQINNIYSGYNAGKIICAKVYAAPCLNPTFIVSDSLNQNTDSTLTLVLSSLTIGNVYYINTTKAIFFNQCANINECNSNALFKIETVNPITTPCAVFVNYKSLVNCVDIDVRSLYCGFNNVNTCDFGSTPLCYSIANNTLEIIAGVFSNNGFGPYPNFDVLVLTNGNIPSYTLTNVTNTLNFPFNNVQSNNINNPAVTYTIIIYPPGQIGLPGGEACNPIIISVVPSPDPSFSISSLCAGPVCFTPNNIGGNHSWLISGPQTFNSNNASPCFTLNPGTYTVTHKMSAMPSGNSFLCSSCTRSVINVVTPIKLNAQSFPQEVCYGQAINLVAFPQGMNSYTWYPSNIIGNIIVVQPTLGVNSYTVVAENAGCTSTAVVNISPYLAQPSFTANVFPEFVCIENNSLTVNIIGGSPTQTIYAPSPSSPTVFTNSVVLFPTATTNYTINSINNEGCLTSSVVIAKMVPCACISAQGSTISGVVYPLQIPDLANKKLKAVGNVTLAYNGPNDPYYGFIGNEIIAYPDVKIYLASSPGGTIFIEGVYAHGCGELWGGFVMPYTYTKLRVRDMQGQSGKTTLIEDAKVAIDVINEIPIIQPNFTQPNRILEVDKVTFNKNIIGIRIGTYQANTINNQFQIQNSLFTSRSIPINTVLVGVSTYPNTQTIKNSLSGNTSPLQSPYINSVQYPPSDIYSNSYIGYPTNGIILNNVGLTLQPGGLGYSYRSVTIGQNGQPNFNCFDNLKEDITAINSNLIIINSVFQNGQRYGKGLSQGGKAIVANSIDNVINNIYNKNFINITSGVQNGNFNCRFYEKTSCAEINNYFHIGISYAEAYSYTNDLANYFVFNTLGERGFNIKTNRFIDISLNKNNFYNIKNAMLIGLDNVVANIGGVPVFSWREIGSILIQNNKVNRYLGSIPPGANPYVNVGVSISDPVATPNFTIQTAAIGTGVGNNLFNQVYNGIGVYNLSHSPVNIVSNNINMINHPNGNNQKGIEGVQLIKRAAIHSNLVSGPVLNYNTAITGISTALNGSLSIRCNTTSSMGRGIEFNRTQTTDFFEDNYMQNERYGLVLDNSAVLSNINNYLGTVIRPTNNIWVGNWSAPNYKTATLGGSSAQQSKLYVQYFPSFFNPDGSATTSLPNIICPSPDLYKICLGPNSTLIDAFPVSLGCRLNNGGVGGGIIAGRQLLEQAVTNNIAYANNAIENVHIDKVHAYRNVKAEPALMAGSNTLTSFYNAGLANNLESMMQIENSLVNANINNAQMQIAALTVSNTIESNYKDYYTIYYRTKDGTYSTTDSLNLYNLANMCPYIDGAVVFQARALYNILYDGFYYFGNFCQPQIAEKTANVESHNAAYESNSVLKTTLYPNPNDGNYLIKVRQIKEEQTITITIYDLMGKIISEENSILRGTNELSMKSDLLIGTYLLKIKMEDGTYDIHRITVSK